VSIFPKIEISMRSIVKTRNLGVATFLLSVVAGCGGPDRPPMGYVSGTITMDGEPLVGVIVVMKPESGRMATAKTDSRGHYDIEYTMGEKGTKIGPNTVSFEWPLGAEATKPIPLKYTAGKSEVTLDVKKGRQTFDLDLESEGGPSQEKNAPKVPD
jgi:hypothetical protein